MIVILEMLIKILNLHWWLYLIHSFHLEEIHQLKNAVDSTHQDVSQNCPKTQHKKGSDRINSIYQILSNLNCLGPQMFETSVRYAGFNSPMFTNPF